MKGSRIKFCCKQIKQSIKEETVNIEGYGKQKYATMWLAPEFVNDGDGYVDNITETTTIEYCPFCGKKITFTI